MDALPINRGLSDTHSKSTPHTDEHQITLQRKRLSSGDCEDLGPHLGLLGMVVERLVEIL